jgi:hypothetical protein
MKVCTSQIKSADNKNITNFITKENFSETEGKMETLETKTEDLWEDGTKKESKRRNSDSTSVCLFSVGKTKPFITAISTGLADASNSGNTSGFSAFPLWTNSNVPL